MRKHIFALFCAGTFATASLGQVQVLVDHVGYETHGPKQALIEGTERDHPEQFLLIDAKSGKEVLSGKPAPAGEVKNWGRWFYWKADFSSWQTPGQYVLKIRTGQDIVRSCPFEIEDDLLERSTLSNVIYYFKGQRSSGAFDRADRHLSLPG